MQVRTINNENESMNMSKVTCNNDVRMRMRSKDKIVVYLRSKNQ